MTNISETSPLRLPSFHFTVSEEWVARQKQEHHTIPDGITIEESSTLAKFGLTREDVLTIIAQLEAKSKRGAVEHNNPTPESNDMYLPNVASLSPVHVDQLTDVVQNMIRTKADEGIAVHGGNGDQETSSLQNYLSWLQERAMADESDGTYTPRDILKTANGVG